MAMVNRALYGPSRPGSHGTVAITPPNIKIHEDRNEMVRLIRACNGTRSVTKASDLGRAMMTLRVFLETCRYLMVNPLQVLHSPYVLVYDPEVNKNFSLCLSDLRKRWAHA